VFGEIGEESIAAEVFHILGEIGEETKVEDVTVDEIQQTISEYIQQYDRKRCK